MEIRIYMHGYNECMWRIYVNLVFFLGIKSTELEILNSVFDETKAETKSY